MWSCALGQDLHRGPDPERARPGDGAEGDGERRGDRAGHVERKGELRALRHHGVGRLYLYAQFAIPPHIDIAKALGSSAFSELNVRAVRAWSCQSAEPPGDERSRRDLPLTGSVAHTAIKIGASNWTLVATARAPFVSGLASSGPLILLILGLFIALIVAMTVEVVQRRHRYAQSLVEERTADLNASMQELQDTQDALVRSERLTAVGEMASVIGHELRNPLAAVTNSLFIVRNDLGHDVSPMTEKYLSVAERETSKAATLADDLTVFVRPREMKMSELQLGDLFNEVLTATPHPDNVSVIVDVGSIDLVGDRGQLAEVLTNLVTNAYQAMPDGGTLHLNGSSEKDAVTIVVEDSGRGVDQTSMSHVFEPFFTTKASGTGLGLAIVQRLVQAHHGEVSITNVPGGGVRATVTLPGVVARVPEEVRS